MMSYNEQYAGHYYQMDGGVAYSINSSGKFAAAYAGNGNAYKVLLTGYYLTTSRGNVMYQTTSGNYIDLTDGWQEVGTANIFQASRLQAQSFVDRIIKSNKTIIANNILCARFAYKLDEQQQEQLRELQNRLQARDHSLREDGICQDLTESHPQGYNYLESYLQQFMDGVSGVGSLTATIIISAVVIASLSTAAYFAYKSMADEAEKDVKYSQELTKALTDKLTPEEYQQLLDETRGIVTKAKIKSSLGSYGSVLKWVAIAAAGVLAYRFIYNRVRS